MSVRYSIRLYLIGTTAMVAAGVVTQLVFDASIARGVIMGLGGAAVWLSIRLHVEEQAAGWRVGDD